MRNATFGALAATMVTACIGTIGGSGDDPGDPPPPPPPPSPTVHVTVQDGSMPQAGVRVLFQHTDGSLALAAMTDAMGAAQYDLPEGGNLTVIRTYPVSTPPRPTEVLTYIGIKGGDKLTVGHAIAMGTPSTINVTVPTGATGNVKVVTPCGTGTGTAPAVPVQVYGCPSQMPVYVEDDNNQAFLAQAPYATAVDLSTQILSDKLSSQISAGNIPAGATVTVDDRLYAGGAELYRTGPQQVEAAPANVNLPNIQTGAEALAVAMVTLPTGKSMIATRKVFAPAPVLFDVNLAKLPAVSAPMFSPTAITWMEQGTGNADFVYATMNVTRGATVFVRAIIAPHTGTSLQVPTLPGTDASYNPIAGDTIVGLHAIGSVTGGYDAARGHAFAVTSPVELAPMSGMALLSYAGDPPSL